ncbi:D-glycerate dehydrogenase [candidate division WWE3 bacterium RIFCSPLOWO2_12_FULL_36_10]|uniref:D-glycerate dehydrogenase n=1 Tax=candidate division WWE3 bacterium RIFCSPLOWO2_12_FULL_36_10 TaxID=1802630 RepID=A0A1F4VH44_UNCKA|nr:MAG: D-glycerate dehydrogenase [candidate division WWE3 bacterium RIFCSPLOWO2_12_FULL_36_10]
MKVLITREIPRAGVDLLRKHPSLELDIRKGPPLSEAELIKAVDGKDAIVSVLPDQINEKVLNAGKPTLRLVANYAVGFDNIDIKTAASLGIYVSNTPGNLTESVAEHALALMISSARNIVQADKYVRAGSYKYWSPMLFLGPVLTKKTLGIIGFGRIGQYLAKIAKGGFDMRILYHDIQRFDKGEQEIGAMYTSLDDLLENSDFISIHVNLMPSTKHLIGERELKKMKPTAYLINTSRGQVIDEAALYTALKDGWIEGAGIDVYENEPKIYSGLTELDNVTLTPHIGSATREARVEMSRMVAENVVEVLINGRPPKNLIKP